MSNHLLINQSSEVQAMRKFLGLETREASELVGFSMRSWQYWERGMKVAPQEVLHLLDSFCNLVKETVEIAKDEDLSNLPYFLEYEEFEKNIPNPTKFKWQLWQRIVGLIRINRYCSALENSGSIKISWKFAHHFINYFEKTREFL